MWKSCTVTAWIFQSTFPRGERLRRDLAFLPPKLFQSTFPRGERQNSGHFLLLVRNFNPRSRVGNDDIGAAFEAIENISIHVPAWGTTDLLADDIRYCLFQSTFPRGERHILINSLFRPVRFQSTFPRGERQTLSRYTLPVFKQFQSTFPRGERQTLVFRCQSSTEYFNPRSRVGNDVM